MWRRENQRDKGVVYYSLSALLLDLKVYLSSALAVLISWKGQQSVIFSYIASFKSTP